MTPLLLSLSHHRTKREENKERNVMETLEKPFETRKYSQQATYKQHLGVLFS